MSFLVDPLAAEQFHANVIVVGGGTAGSIVAARLSEDADCRVLLLEAGAGFATPADFPDALKYGTNAGLALRSGHAWTTRGVPSEWSDEPIPIPRGKVLGGTSAIDGRIHLWGLPDDYDRWSSLDGTWSFQQVLPHLQQIEQDLDHVGDWHGRTGLIPVRRSRPNELSQAQAAFINAVRDIGVPEVADMNSPAPKPGVGYFPLTTINGIRRTPTTEYLYPVSGRANLGVLPETQVVEVLLSHGRVTGVAARNHGRRMIVGAQHVVLSAGTFGTPHLLMLSGIGPERSLQEAGIDARHRLEGVGRNLQDHPLATFVYTVADGEEEDVPMLQVGWRLSSGQDESMDLGIWPFSAVKEELAQYPTPGLQPGQVSCRMAVSLRDYPTDAGFLEVRSSDPDTEPRVEFRYFSSQHDADRLCRAVDLVLDIENSRKWLKVAPSRVVPPDSIVRDRAQLIGWLRRAARGSHGVGTCRMGNDSNSVVDWNGRVHGIENLWIADASIMPQIVRVNPAATVMMIAERVVQLSGLRRFSSPRVIASESKH